MATSSRYTVKFRRKREGRTDYRKRLRSLAGGHVRLVVRKSLHHIRLQLIEYNSEGDKVLASASTQELAKKGYKGQTSNMPAAYLCGLLLAKKAAKKIKNAIADIGTSTPVAGAVIFAAVAGCREGGISIPMEEKAQPPKERMKGSHIASYAGLLKKNEAAYKKTFSAYLKKGLAPEKLPEHVDDIASKIKGEA